MPRGGHYNPGRQAVYDRAPVSQLQLGSVPAAGPHIVTQRYVRTVPAGMRALVSAAAVTILRNTAAGAVGLIEAYCIVTSSAVSTRLITLFLLTNGVGDTQHDTWGGEVYLNAGDAVSGNTIDPSTGGTVTYVLSCVMTEFSQ